MDREKLQRGLGLFLDAMRPYVVTIISRECPEGTSWDVDFERKIDNERKRTNWQMQRMQLNNNGSSLQGVRIGLSLCKQGFDPASEDDMDDNGMNRYMENNDEEGWD